MWVLHPFALWDGWTALSAWHYFGKFLAGHRFYVCLFRVHLASAGAIHPPSVGVRHSILPHPLLPFPTALPLSSPHLRLAPTPTLVEASRSPLPGLRRCVRSEIPRTPESETPTLSERFLPPLEAFNFNPQPSTSGPQFLVPIPAPPTPLTLCPAPFTLHSSYPCIPPQSIQTFGLTNFT
jgi:hypothetical protein